MLVSQHLFQVQVEKENHTFVFNLRFLKPNKGQILFDGVELKSIHQFSKNLIEQIFQES